MIGKRFKLGLESSGNEIPTSSTAPRHANGYSVLLRGQALRKWYVNLFKFCLATFRCPNQG